MSASVIPMPLLSAKAPFSRLCHGVDYLKTMAQRNQNLSKTMHIFVFDLRGKVLGIERGSSLDFIHGRMEWDDDTYLDAARREVREQTGLTLGDVGLAAVVETGRTALDVQRFEMVLSGFVEDEDLLKQSCDSFLFVAPDVFIGRYQLGDRIFIQQVLSQARVRQSAIDEVSMP